ncbi:MAG: LTA synthase family protein [Oscillospiraceae bacterium]|nr:LTA synthase family protein [Oscillospiraceae bacterium]
MNRLRALWKRRWRLPLIADIGILIAGVVLIWLGMAYVQPEWVRGVYFDFIERHPMLIILNGLPILVILAGLYFATGRSLFSILITGSFFIAMGLVNSIKISTRSDPFVPADLRLLREAFAILQQSWAGHFLTVFAVILGVVLLAVLIVRFFSVQRIHLIIRLAGPLACLVLFTTLTFTVYADRDLYYSFTRGAVGNRFADYNRQGFVYSFMHDLATRSVREPAYLNHAAFTVLEAEAAPPTDVGVRPNVVMIMAEAFSDLTEEPHFDFAGRRDPLENFRQISGDALVAGDLIVDVFGGATVFTEFAALTGISPVTLSDTIVPYEFVRNNTDSIVWQFRNLGYDTIALHPFDSWFYNRANVFQRLGFDLFLHGHGEGHFLDAPFRGGFVSEEATFDALIEIVDDRAALDEPLFLFCITIQNHAIYQNKYFFALQDLFDTDLEMTWDERMTLENYIYGLFDVDEQMARLVARLEADPEPYILIYFSDHQPMIRRRTFEQMGWGDLFGPPLEAMRMFTVPFFIWQNEAARQEMDLEERVRELGLDADVEVSAFYLGAMLLQLLEFDRWSPFFSHVNELRTELPVMRPGVYRAAGGEFVTTLPPHLREVFDFYHAWSHYKLFYQVVG